MKKTMAPARPAAPCTECLILLGITLASGIIAGCFCTAVENAQAIGLIIKAEEFEVQEEIPEGTELDVPMSDDAQPEEWFPADGAPRHLCTMVSNWLCMWGFSMILVGVFHARDAPVGGLDAVQNARVTLWGGLCAGAVGWIIFGFSTGLNLPPELPGMVAGQLGWRQGCWIFTAAMTTLGLGLLAYGDGDSVTAPRSLARRVLGVIALLLPQLVGAPEYEHLAGGADRPPPELAAKFTVAALMAQGVSWLFLGVVTAVGYNKYYMMYGDTRNLDATKSQELRDGAAHDAGSNP